jgi:heat shock protein HslJ
MHKRQLFAGALTAGLLVSALPGLVFAQDDDAAASPEGVEWTLTTLAGEPVPEGVETTLLLSGGEAVGNAGCNSYFGSYELDGDSLTFPDPFGVTRMFCEGPQMEVEDAYLPLLQATATWSIDDEGALSLADADGAVQLVYAEAPVDITASDVDALVATLGDLQTQIDEASAEVAALTAAAESIDVNRFDRRLNAAEQSISGLEEQVGDVNSVNLRRRIVALEETVARLDRTIDRFRERIIALEDTTKEQNRRLKALEDAVFVPSPASE